MNIRQKFLIGFGILLAVLGISGLLMLRQVNKLGQAVDVILRENYQSVIICQNVNEALERIDSGLLFSFTGWKHPEQNSFRKQIEKINRQWDAELQNLTVPGERERAMKIHLQLKEYIALIPEILNEKNSAEERGRIYRKAHPLFLELKKGIGEILLLNQDNMSSANNAARMETRLLQRRGITLLFACIVFILLFSVILTRWIQQPLRKLISMTNEIANGNLSLLLDSKSNDEIGQLSRSFNAMTISLRNALEQLVGKLHRSEQMNKDVFRELPTPIAVFDARNNRIELATQSAKQYFEMNEGKRIDEFQFEWLPEICDQVRRNGNPGIARRNGGIIQHFIDGKEYFFQPTAVPLPAGASPERLTGIVVILKDVTMAHEQQELKRSVISTVSHQLKTPLTSLQMSIYLLLEEKCGPLNPEQTDLILAMRDDSRRLTEIIGELLNLNKASDCGSLKTGLYSPRELLAEAENRFRAECREHSIELKVECNPLIPKVPLALNRINYALDNLISNAIRFTPPGGRILLRAKVLDDSVEFTTADTGRGMAKDVQKHIFEPFYRGPGQDSASGIGLGLSIAREIINAHSGRIQVRSKENSGTVFSFTLPLVTDTERESICL